MARVARGKERGNKHAKLVLNQNKIVFHDDFPDFFLVATMKSVTGANVLIPLISIARFYFRFSFPFGQ